MTQKNVVYSTPAHTGSLSHFATDEFIMELGDIPFPPCENCFIWHVHSAHGTAGRSSGGVMLEKSGDLKPCSPGTWVRRLQGGWVQGMMSAG